MRTWMAEARKSKGYTLKETGEKLGITESYYLMIEQGKRQVRLDIALATKMADVFDVSLERIVEYESMPDAAKAEEAAT